MGAPGLDAATALPHHHGMLDRALFDPWPDRYDRWFTTPIGALVRQTEGRLILDMLQPAHGELILDAGCGTGVFTMDYVEAGATVVGLDISVPMLAAAARKAAALETARQAAGRGFAAVRGDMLDLPFVDGQFDKSVSVTALEFIADAQRAVDELFRVTRPGGLVVIGTLNSLSSWAARRRAKTERGERHVLEQAFFRSPGELLALGPAGGRVATAVHFEKDDPPERALEVERLGASQESDTGAFVVACWRKPASQEAAERLP
jgi:ubiquinone/menaquinone biosynthesis C-methylase UbiE